MIDPEVRARQKKRVGRILMASGGVLLLAGALVGAMGLGPRPVAWALLAAGAFDLAIGSVFEKIAV